MFFSTFESELISPFGKETTPKPEAPKEEGKKKTEQKKKMPV
jgi:hypothetical protein